MALRAVKTAFSYRLIGRSKLVSGLMSLSTAFGKA
jgi:hypothetical protein